MSDLLKDFDFKGGQIIFIDHDLDFSQSLAGQLEILREDMALVRYGQHYLLDLGYYPEFSAEGIFRLWIIKNEVWDSPVKEWNPKTSIEVKRTLEAALIFLEQEMGH